MNVAALAVPTGAGPELMHARAVGAALWLFIGVASVLFALFLAAFAMRIDAPDWSPVALPPQLWLSTALLAAASALLHGGTVAARAARLAKARRYVLAAGAATAAFLGTQLWAWQVLLDARVALAANPAASFFYLLSAMHGLHVIGGLIAWSIAAQPLWSRDGGEAVAAAWRIGLCARYWHFLLVLWALLFGALAQLTPELVRELCSWG